MEESHSLAFDGDVDVLEPRVVSPPKVISKTYSASAGKTWSTTIPPRVPKGAFDPGPEVLRG
jgi:hypothetical protein